MLLSEGEDRTISPSVIGEYFAKSFDSLAGNYRDLEGRIAQLQEGIQYLRARLAGVGTKALYVDLSSQMASLIERGQLVAQYPVSSGAYDTPTPKGTFEIHRKQTLRVSNLDVPYRMPYYMAFTESESHGFHALPFLGKNPESSDFWQEARSHIGIPVSHGCVRLLPEDAAKVYEWVEVGTKVYISA
jgi:lipoprotein-anchoring transpeptidase ErfK/SrfK